jgi:hypothetical protein
MSSLCKPAAFFWKGLAYLFSTVCKEASVSTQRHCFTISFIALECSLTPEAQINVENKCARPSSFREKQRNKHLQYSPQGLKEATLSLKRGCVDTP